MIFSATVACFAVLLATPISAAPAALHNIQKYNGQTIKDNYIVTFKAGSAKARAVSSLGSAVKAEWDIINGFVGQLDSEALNALRANPDVEGIHEDGIVSISATVTQSTATWGLQRISQAAKINSTSTAALTYSYRYDNSAGAGVDAYIIDTGIFTNHSEFGGRARWGATFGGYANADGNGHGTHVSGTLAGTNFGVAKAANLIAVKVLDDSGTGAISDVVSGMNFARTSALASGRPSIVSMSLGAAISTPIDTAVAALTSAGVHTVVAAGNDASDAANTSPARAPTAITVGAMDITDVMAAFSNVGSVVDVYAPGVSVISSWIGSTTATNSISGTSMATPHVAGLVAYLIGLNGNVSPADMSTNLKSLALKNVIRSIPSGTANNLVSNGI